MPAVITSAAIGAGTAIYGGIKSAQAAKAAKANLANRPTYTPLAEDDSELNLAQSMSGTGMSDTSRQALLNNNQNAQAASINAIQRNGGDPNAIGNLYGQAQNGLNSAAIYDDQARMSHLNTLLGTYAQYNAQRRSDADKTFQIDQYAPWADKQQLITQQQQAAQNLILSGLGTTSKALVSYKAPADPPKDPGTRGLSGITPFYGPMTSGGSGGAYAGGFSGGSFSGPGGG